MTSETIRNIIRDKVEDMSVPNLVYAWVQENQGKRLRVDKVPNIVRVIKDRDRTVIESPDYWKTGGRRGSRFLLADADKNVIIPSPEKFRELNPREYAGAEERNLWRLKTLKDPDKLQAIAEAVTKAQETKRAYEEAMKELDSLTGYPGPDHYEFKKLVEGEK